MFVSIPYVTRSSRLRNLGCSWFICNLARSTIRPTRHVHLFKYSNILKSCSVVFQSHESTYRWDVREPIAFGNLHGSILAKVVHQMNMPLIRHDVFFGRMDYGVYHGHDDHCHQAWPPGPGHLQPRPHGHRLDRAAFPRSANETEQDEKNEG